MKVIGNNLGNMSPRKMSPRKMSPRKMSRNIAAMGVIASCLVLTGPAMALTFKSGQVLGADGKLYDGASPEQAANIIAASKETGLFGAKRKSAGVKGNNLYVIVNDTVTFIPLNEVRGKSDGQIEALIVERVTETFSAGFLQGGEGGGTAGSAAGSAAAQAAAQAAGQGASDEVLATQEEINAALDSVSSFSAAASEAAALTREAWGDISGADLEAAVAEATAHAVAEAAAVVEYLDITEALEELQASGASEAEIDAFIAANPAP